MHIYLALGTFLAFATRNSRTNGARRQFAPIATTRICTLTLLPGSTHGNNSQLFRCERSFRIRIPPKTKEQYLPSLKADRAKGSRPDILPATPRDEPTPRRTTVSGHLLRTASSRPDASSSFLDGSQILHAAAHLPQYRREYKLEYTQNISQPRSRRPTLAARSLSGRGWGRRGCQEVCHWMFKKR